MSLPFVSASATSLIGTPPKAGSGDGWPVGGCSLKFRYLNGAPLNDAHFELEANFLEHWETKLDGKRRHFPWITDLPIDDANAFGPMRPAYFREKLRSLCLNLLVPRPGNALQGHRVRFPQHDRSV